MNRNKRLIYITLMIALIVSSACLRNTDEEVRLLVENEKGESFQLEVRDLAGLRRVAVRATDKNGDTSDFEGVALVDALRWADAPYGDRLRGKNMTAYVVVEGADGYKTAFTLAELDPDFSNKTVVLADKRDGRTLSKDEGKLRLVVPDENKRQARWVRQVVKLTIKLAE